MFTEKRTEMKGDGGKKMSDEKDTGMTGIPQYFQLGYNMPLFNFSILGC